MTRPTTASRGHGKALAFDGLSSELVAWVSEQAEIASKSAIPLRLKAGIACHVRHMARDTGDLPIAYMGESEFSFHDLRQVVEEMDCSEFQLFDFSEGMLQHPNPYPEFGSEKNHIGVFSGRFHSGWLAGQLHNDPYGRGESSEWRRYWYSFLGACIEAVASGWKCQIDEMLRIWSTQDKEQQSILIERDILRRPSNQKVEAPAE